MHVFVHLCVFVHACVCTAVCVCTCVCVCVCVVYAYMCILYVHMLFVFTVSSPFFLHPLSPSEIDQTYQSSAPFPNEEVSW